MQGFLKFENWINDEGYSVSLSYWDSVEAINSWKTHTDHLDAKKKAKWAWYKWCILLKSVQSTKVIQEKKRE